MEGGIEAGHLGQAGQGRAHRVDAGQVVRLVQGRQRDEAAQLVDHGGIEHDGLREFLSAMHHAMPDAGDLPASLVAVQPVDQQAQGGLVRGFRRAVEV